MGIVIGSGAGSPAGTASTGVCSSWCTASDLPCTAAAFDTSLVADCVRAASDVLYELSGRRWPGECADVVRPGARSVPGDLGPQTGAASVVHWPAWRGWTCGCNQSEEFGCSRVPEVLLPGVPVTGITEIKVDGVILPSSAYRLDDDRKLVRVDGQGWPCCQSLALATTEAGTWQVSYTHGRLPGPMGKLAAAALACQLCMAFTPAVAGECKLPKRVTSITRQGVTAVVLDPMSFLDKGRTGLVEVDLFLASANPKGIPRVSSVRRPEFGRAARRSG